jgi:hypothetical protein
MNRNNNSYIIIKIILPNLFLIPELLTHIDKFNVFRNRIVNYVFTFMLNLDLTPAPFHKWRGVQRYMYSTLSNFGEGLGEVVFSFLKDIIV